MSVFRIGAGAGFSGDRIEPAIDLAERGQLDALVFECLAERTIALAQQAKLRDPAAGFDPYLERRLRGVLPACARNGTKIITNMGAANPKAAAQKALNIAAELGLKHLKIAAVTGDDVLQEISDYPLDVTGERAAALGNRLVSANAYTGVAGIIEALDLGADVVICGRVADPALFLAPLMHHYNWGMSDHIRLGRGTLIGHLLECAAQVTGGYFADPGVKDVPNLARVGFPIAEVDDQGNAVITKLRDTGGLVNRATCTEQLLYEIHDPAEYLQPDVVADFSKVKLAEVGLDRVAVSGGSGRAPTGRYKVSVGYRDSWLGEGQISYAGVNCLARVSLAKELILERLEPWRDQIVEIRSDIIGVNSVVRQPQASDPPPRELRLRIAARCQDQDTAQRVAFEVESLYLSGPAGGGGVFKQVREILGVASTLVPTNLINTHVEMFEVHNETA